MMQEMSPCRVLLVEDEPGDAHLVRQILRAAAEIRFDVTWVSRFDEARQVLRSHPLDVMLLDLSLPDSHGMDTVQMARQAAGTLPLIVLTGHDDTGFALQALDFGAQDYLVKGRFDTDGLVRTIRYAISRAKLEQRLREAEERWRFALEGAGDGVWDWQIQTNQVSYSKRWQEMFGLADTEMGNRFDEWVQRVHPEDIQRVTTNLHAYFEAQSITYSCEYRMRHEQGHWLWMLARGIVVSRSTTGTPLRMIGTHTDITVRKLAEERDHLLVSALEAVANGVVITDIEAKIEWVNPAFEHLTGYSRSEAIGRRPADLVRSGQHERPFYVAMWDTILKGDTWRGEVLNKRKDGGLYHEELVIAPVKDRAGKICHFVGVKQDISARKHLEAQLLEMATTDELTGLPNRRHFLARLEEEFARMQRRGVLAVSVLMLDLDYFKSINDTYTHIVGDRVLQHFADLLRGVLRKTDTPGRIGGEEFAVLLPGADLAAAQSLAQRLCHTVANTPLHYDTQTISTTVSIGIAAMLADDPHSNLVLIRADKALFGAKDAGRNCVRQDESGSASHAEPVRSCLP